MSEARFKAVDLHGTRLGNFSAAAPENWSGTCNPILWGVYNFK